MLVLYIILIHKVYYNVTIYAHTETWLRRGERSGESAGCIKSLWQKTYGVYCTCCFLGPAHMDLHFLWDSPNAM